WTLRLADGARFHDDRSVSSDDAARSLRRFLRSPSTAAARLAGALGGGAAYRARATEDLPGLRAPGPGRLVLRLARPPLLPPPAPATRRARLAGCGGDRCGGLGMRSVRSHARRAGPQDRPHGVRRPRPGTALPRRRADRRNGARRTEGRPPGRAARR